MNSGPCMCGDPACRSCGTAQGTYQHPRPKKRRRQPPKQTIRSVLTWLAAYDMHVYGPNMNVETGAEFGGNLDYNVDMAIKRAKHVDKGTNFQVEDEE